MFVDLDVQNFSLLWSPIVPQLFPPFMTGSDKLGWDHMAGESASPYVRAVA